MAEYVIPEHLRGRSFGRREARAADVYDSELRRRKDLRRPTHGAWTTEEIDSLAGRCRGVLPVLPPGAGFSHVTSGELHDLPLPLPRQRQVERDVMTRTDHTQRRRAEWLGHQGAESREIVVLDGIPVVGLVDTWCDLAEYAVGRTARMGADDLVVLGDEVLNRLILALVKEMLEWEQPRHPVRDPRLVAEALSAFDRVIERRVRPRGKRAMRLARPLLRAGVRSPQETRARLMFVHAGFPEPEVNADVHDQAGGWLGEGDLVWRQQRVVVEYQSEHHVDRRQRSRDSAKTSAFVEAGWRVHEMWAEDCRPGVRQVKFLRRVAQSLAIAPPDLGLG
jgi:hypothetical protein